MLKKIFFSLLALFSLFKTKLILAYTGDTGLSDAAPSSLENAGSIQSFIGKVIGAALGFTGTIFFVLVIYAGLKWMTSAGNEEQIEKSKKILIAAIIGLVIVVSAYAITSFVGETLTGK